MVVPVTLQMFVSLFVPLSICFRTDSHDRGSPSHRRSKDDSVFYLHKPISCVDSRVQAEALNERV